MLITKLQPLLSIAKYYAFGAVQFYADYRIIHCHIAMADTCGTSGEMDMQKPCSIDVLGEVGIMCADTDNLLESLGEVLPWIRGIAYSSLVH